MGLAHERLVRSGQGNYPVGVQQVRPKLWVCALQNAIEALYCGSNPDRTVVLHINQIYEPTVGLRAPSLMSQLGRL